ncbi:uncharacterized protein LOC130662852 [Hydractinia symbiolongicarpus]|uniref:uncharacterized protein LOC130662852 n=1 Tax=Hydractinia symbiolongicarpus TaxID=13093 RepID=UPI00254DBEAB|nr:uncharacterized protein LOC130662852 [Hydractinia symbiolongicarpus]
MVQSRNRRTHRPRNGGFRRRNYMHNKSMQQNAENEKNKIDNHNWNVDTSIADNQIRDLFTKQSYFSSHYNAQNELPHRYFACLHVLLKNRVEILENSKSLSLAAAWARKDYTMAEYLLKVPDEKFGIKEVLRAVTILDSARNKRAQERLLKRLGSQNCKKRGKLMMLKSLIGSIKADIPMAGSLSGALIKHIKLWVRTIPVERLEFYAMHFPSEPWKKLANVCHLNPKKDFPQCTWFLPFCFEKTTLPETILLSGIANLNSENINEVIMRTDIDYTIARKWVGYLTNEAKKRIASYSKIDTVLWYFEELQCDLVEKVLYERLLSNEEIKLSYGKLVERIIHFKGRTTLVQADKRLQSMEFEMDSPVVVIGDKSGSMEVAIRTSTIIASLVAAATNADLVFFDNKNVIPSFIPKNVADVLRLCDEIKAEGVTIPAASLYPYYEEKKVVKTFVVVTDEEETGVCHGDRFAHLFKKYYEEVYPARLVFVSFLEQSESGEMITMLKEHAPDISPMQFRFNINCPDLTKLDNVFGLLSSKSEGFSKQVSNAENLFRQKDITKAVERLKI